MPHRRSRPSSLDLDLALRPLAFSRQHNSRLNSPSSRPSPVSSSCSHPRPVPRASSADSSLAASFSRSPSSRSSYAWRHVRVGAPQSTRTRTSSDAPPRRPPVNRSIERSARLGGILSRFRLLRLRRGNEAADHARSALLVRSASRSSSDAARATWARAFRWLPAVRPRLACTSCEWPRPACGSGVESRLDRSLASCFMRLLAPLLSCLSYRGGALSSTAASERPALWLSERLVKVQLRSASHSRSVKTARALLAGQAVAVRSPDLGFSLCFLE